MNDYYILAGMALTASALIGGISAARFAITPSQGWKLVRYTSNVLALVIGAGLGQFLLSPLLQQYGIDTSNPVFTVIGFFIGAFAAMAMVQAVELIERRRHGLEPMPYRPIRFDLMRW